MEREKGSAEQAWKSWREVHDRIAEEAIGRKRKIKQNKSIKDEWDQDAFAAVREKNRLRREMGRVQGQERKQVDEEYKKWRARVKKILTAKRNKRRQERNERLENFRGRDEKKFCKYLKSLTGLDKKDEKLPDEVQVGDRVERGEKRKEVWNEGFRLGKFNIDDPNLIGRSSWRLRRR